MKKIKIILVFLMAILITNGCKKETLEIPFVDNPDFAKVFSSGTNLVGLAGGLYNNLYLYSHYEGGVQPLLATASDASTCSYGNFGMRDLSYEPRDFAWNNAASYSYNTQTNEAFNGLYKSITSASNILKAMNNGVVIPAASSTNPGPAGIKAWCRFAQGAGYADLALIFDRAFVVDEVTIVESKLSSAVPYTAVATGALKYLDEAIALCAANTFTIPTSWTGTSGSITNVELGKICNTLAARLIAYLPRTKAQNAAANWAKVKTYADAGITSDFSVVVDDNIWYDYSSYYLGQGNGTWGRTDMYVVNLMDPVGQPAHWDDSPTFPTPPASVAPADKRLLSDFEYMPSNTFIAGRGYYHFSNYRSKRYDFIYASSFTGAKPELMKAENDMLRAEARLYSSTPDLIGAAAIINAGTRVTRGQLAPVAPVAADLVKAIHQERLVEMPFTSANISFYEMRKLDLLQKGTPLHMPIPAKVLEILGAPTPFYTFGTVAKADGINTSNAGWR